MRDAYYIGMKQKLFTLISYKLKASDGIEYQMNDIYLTCEADIKLEKMWKDKRVTCIQPARFDSLKEARAVQERLRK